MIEKPGSWIDPIRSACLYDVGGGLYTVAVVVTEDGDEDLVLINEEHLRDEQHNTYDRAPRARHEQLGPLPDGVRYRVWQVPVTAHRCGRPTKTTGRPCRIEVSRPGEPCGIHRQRQETA